MELTEDDIKRATSSCLIEMLVALLQPIVAGDGRDITPASQKRTARLVAAEIDRRMPVPPAG